MGDVFIYKAEQIPKKFCQTFFASLPRLPQGRLAPGGVYQAEYPKLQKNSKQVWKKMVPWLKVKSAGPCFERRLKYTIGLRNSADADAIR